jgi:dolichyl-phosphate-mannose-protein mannosyltransferase
MTRRGWTPAQLAGLAVLILAGIVLRIVIWPQNGLAGDLDEYVRWVHGIAVNGWSHAYDQNLSYPAVMIWIWGALTVVQPAFQTATDASDLAVKIAMKLPATIADVGLALGVVYWFRDQPRVALAAAGALFLWPALWFMSAWWGQTESIYVLVVLVAVLTARAGRLGPTAILLGIALMTKPQAFALAVPFAAWFLATGGWRGAARAAVAIVVVAVIAWLPFAFANGPANYLHNLDRWQNGVFPILSVRAWNPWWILQEFVAGGSFVLDSNTIAGPVTFRLVGLASAALVELVVFIGVYRRPTTMNLAMGLAASSIGALITLTTMHERYAFAALVFLLLAWPRREVVVAWIAYGIALALNLVYAVPPPGFDPLAPNIVSVAGSLVVTAVGIAAIRWTWRGEAPATEPGSAGDQAHGVGSGRARPVPAPSSSPST